MHYFNKAFFLCLTILGFQWAGAQCPLDEVPSSSIFSFDGPAPSERLCETRVSTPQMIYSGDAYEIEGITAANQYVVGNCEAAGSWNLTITVYDPFGNVVAYDDGTVSGCGNGAQVSFIASVSGTYTVVVADPSCDPNTDPSNGFIHLYNTTNAVDCPINTPDDCTIEGFAADIGNDALFGTGTESDPFAFCGDAPFTVQIDTIIGSIYFTNDFGVVYVFYSGQPSGNNPFTQPDPNFIGLLANDGNSVTISTNSNPGPHTILFDSVAGPGGLLYNTPYVIVPFLVPDISDPTNLQLSPECIGLDSTEPFPYFIFLEPGVDPLCGGNCEDLSIEVEVSIECDGVEGLATFSATGGNEPYTFEDADGNELSNPHTFTGDLQLEVFALDAAGCLSEVGLQIDTSCVATDPCLNVNISLEIEDLCFPDGTGSLNAIVSGGEEPYQLYDEGLGPIDPNTVFNDETLLTLFVLDANGCSSDTVEHMVECDTLDVCLVVIEPSYDNVCEEDQGYIVLSAEGGTPPYSFVDQGGNTLTDTLYYIGTINLEVSTWDSNDCLSETILLIEETCPDPCAETDLTIEVQTTCLEDTSLYLLEYVVAGGVEPYQIEGDTTGSLIQAGQQYSITVTDSIGCHINATGEDLCEDPCELNPIEVTIETVCLDGGNVFELHYTISGGTAPYDTLGVHSGETLPGGEPFTISLVDALGCVFEQEYLIDCLDPCAELPIEVSIETICLDGANAFELYYTILGGVAPYDTLGVENGAVLNGGEPFTISVRDSRGCLFEREYLLDCDDPCINSNVFLELFFDCINDEEGNPTGQAEIGAISGGDGQPVWGGDDLDAIYSHGDTVIVSLMDASLCTVFDTLVVDCPSNLCADFELLAEVECETDGTTNIDFEIIGGQPNYEVFVRDTVFSADNFFSISFASDEVISVLITDANGCELVYEPQEQLCGDCTAFEVSGTIECDEDGSLYDVVLNLSGGSGPYELSGDVFGSFDSEEFVIPSTPAGNTLSVIVTDRFGCEDTYFTGFVDCKPNAIELFAFSAVANHDDNLIQWQTLSITDAENFIIERSPNGIHFDELAQISIEENAFTAQSFNYIDQKINDNYYYRLSITYNDGAKEVVSEVVYVDRQPASIGLSIVPNPVNETLNWKLQSQQTATLRVYNSVGKLIHSEQISHQRGNYDTSALRTGTYFIRISGEGFSESLPFIKH